MLSKVFATIIAVGLISPAIILSAESQASATRGEVLSLSQEIASVPDARRPAIGDQGELELVNPADENELAPQEATAIKYYWKILSFSCVCGGRIHLWVDGKYKGYATGPGTWTVKKLKLQGGHKYIFYAEDECGTTAWGPSQYKMKSSWKSFTWTLDCGGGGITPTGGTWTGTTSRSQPMSFQVISSGTQYQNFTLKTDFDFGGCWGTTETTVTSVGSINNGGFSSTGGTFGYACQFNSATAATGTYAYSGLYIYPCGYLYQSGTWTANWTAAGLESEIDGQLGQSDQPGRRDVIILDRSGCTER